MSDFLSVPCSPVVNGIPHSHWKCTFETFDFAFYPELKDLTLRFLAGEYFWLYLHGEPGRGKTHYSVALHRAIVHQVGWESTDSSSFIEWSELTRQIKQSFKDYSTEELIEGYCEAETLMLDDINGKMGDFQIRSLESIIQQRFSTDRRLVITSNESYETFLSLFGAHEVSRIKSLCAAFKMCGVDRRLA
jgi:DNA replication protein DnaC